MQIRPLLATMVNLDAIRDLYDLHKLDSSCIDMRDPATFLALLGNDPLATLRTAYASRLTDFLFYGFLIVFDNDPDNRSNITTTITLISESTSLRVINVNQHAYGLIGSATQLIDSVIKMSQITRLREIGVAIYANLNNTELKATLAESVERVVEGSKTWFKRKCDR